MTKSTPANIPPQTKETLSPSAVGPVDYKLSESELRKIMPRGSDAFIRANSRPDPVEDQRQDGAPGESEVRLHERIAAWCDSHNPRWVYIHSRTDRESTIQVGCHDFTIFGPFPLCLLLEIKSRDGKLRPEQVVWKHEMGRLGWTVQIARSITQFLEIVKAHGYE